MSLLVRIGESASMKSTEMNKANIDKQHRTATQKKTASILAKTRSLHVHLSKLPFAAIVSNSSIHRYTRLQERHTHRRQRPSSRSFLQVSTPVRIPSADDEAGIGQCSGSGNGRGWFGALGFGFFAVMVQRGGFGVETWELSIGQSVARENGSGVTSPHLSPHSVLTLDAAVLRCSAHTPLRDASSQLPTPSHATCPRKKPTRHFRPARLP